MRFSFVDFRLLVCHRKCTTHHHPIFIWIEVILNLLSITELFVSDFEWITINWLKKLLQYDKYKTTINKRKRLMRYHDVYFFIDLLVYSDGWRKLHYLQNSNRTSVQINYGNLFRSLVYVFEGTGGSIFRRLKYIKFAWVVENQYEIYDNGLIDKLWYRVLKPLNIIKLSRAIVEY